MANEGFVDSKSRLQGCLIERAIGDAPGWQTESERE